MGSESSLWLEGPEPAVIGFRTDDLASTIRFFSEVLELPLAERDEANDFVGFHLPSGQLFEVFGPKSKEYQFHDCPVVGFGVEDVRATKQQT